MPRTARVSPAGIVFRVLNRGVGRMQIFRAEKDYHAFPCVAEQTLVARAEDWKWGSLHQRVRSRCGPLLGDWPLPRPSDWTEYVNLPQTEVEVESIRRCVGRGSPYGAAAWIGKTAEQLGLQSAIRARGRPRKQPP